MLKKIASVVFMAFGYLWTGASMLMNWIGRSTLPEDSQTALGVATQGLNWLFSTPWWVPGLLALAATGFFVWANWPRRTIETDDGTVTVLPGIPTSVRIQFKAGSHNAVTSASKNLRVIHAQRQGMELINAADGQSMGGKITWLIFLVFEKPLALGQLVIDSHGAPLPDYSVQASSPFHLAILIDGDMGNSLIEIRDQPVNQA